MHRLAAAGHDRCIVPIQAEHLDEWLNLRPRKLMRLYEMLEFRERSYYERRGA